MSHDVPTIQGQFLTGEPRLPVRANHAPVAIAQSQDTSSTRPPLQFGPGHRPVQHAAPVLAPRHTVGGTPPNAPPPLVTGPSSSAQPKTVVGWQAPKEAESTPAYAPGWPTRRIEPEEQDVPGVFGTVGQPKQMLPGTTAAQPATMASGGGSSNGDEAPKTVIQDGRQSAYLLQFPPPRGQGQPLPPVVQARMESLFGQSFSDVRVHVGHHVSSVGALAYTHGSNIHFAPGQYNPMSLQGLKLLAHELTHVIQQKSGRVKNPFGTGVAIVNDRAMEAEADRKADEIALDGPVLLWKQQEGREAKIAARSEGE